MDRGRWAKAKERTKRPRHEVRNLIFAALGALIVGVPIAFTKSAIALGSGGAIGAVVGYILSVYWERIWAYVKEPMLQLEVRLQELENRPPHSAAATSPELPALVITPIVGKSQAHFSEKFEKPYHLVPGVIYTKIAVNVSARPDTPFPITVIRYKAQIQVDGDRPHEMETAEFRWFDGEDSNENRLFVQPGITLGLVLSFSFKVKSDWTPYIPESAQLIGLTVFDALNNRYELGETISLNLVNVSDPF